MKQPAFTGFKRLQAAFRNSLNGFRDVWQREEAFRLECILLAMSLPATYWLASGLGQAGLLIGSILLLLIVETLNSAIEATIDRIGTEWHELSRVAKDLGSAAVLMASIVPIIAWGAVILGRLGVITL